MAKYRKSSVQITRRTAKSFGYEWTKFSNIFKEYEDNFLSYIYPVDKKFFIGKTVLDAGCGNGRHAIFASKYGAKRVVGLDLSKEVVNVAKENTKELKAVEIIQGNISSLPNKLAGQFDIVLCIGVLHHLPSPQKGFEQLIKTIKHNGTILIWVYSKENNKLAKYLYEPARTITKKLPYKIIYGLAFLVGAIVQIANWTRLPIFKQYIKFPFKTKWNDAFDMLSAPKASYYSIEEIEAWFKESGLRDISVRYRILNKVQKGIIGEGVKR